MQTNMKRITLDVSAPAHRALSIAALDAGTSLRALILSRLGLVTAHAYIPPEDGVRLAQPLTGCQLCGEAQEQHA